MYFFIAILMLFVQEIIRFVYILESPRRGDSNKYTKRMIHKKLCKSIRYSCLRRIHIKFLYTSKFDLTAKSFCNKQCRYNEGPLYTCIEL